MRCLQEPHTHPLRRSSSSIDHKRHRKLAHCYQYKHKRKHSSKRTCKWRYSYNPIRRCNSSSYSHASSSLRAFLTVRCSVCLFSFVLICKQPAAFWRCVLTPI